MQLEIVAIHQRANDPIKTVEALGAVAHMMADAGQADAAVDYLARADRILRAVPDPEVASLHTTILGDLGQAHARLGRINSARNHYHRALALGRRHQRGDRQSDPRPADRVACTEAAEICLNPVL